MADDPLKDPPLRLFLAIPFHELFFRELEAVLERLSRRIPDVQWVRPGQTHLTLHFFGTTPSDDLEKIDHAIRQVAVNFRPFPVCLEPIGGFPDLNHPRVIWVGVRDQAGQILSLHQAVREKVSRLGFPVEERPFHAHVTLGRVKKKIADPETTIAKMGFQFPTGTKTLDRFHLYQSHCLPGGARYEILKTYPFPTTP